MLRRTFITAGAIALASAAAFAAGGGIPKVSKGSQEQSGPLGFPPLKKLAESLNLTHDQEQALLRIYNEYQKKEHEAIQEARRDSSGKASASTDTKSLRGDMINEIKAILTEDQRKKLDEALSESGKKKKKT